MRFRALMKAPARVAEKRGAPEGPGTSEVWVRAAGIRRARVVRMAARSAFLWNPNGIPV